MYKNNLQFLLRRGGRGGGFGGAGGGGREALPFGGVGRGGRARAERGAGGGRERGMVGGEGVWGGGKGGGGGGGGSPCCEAPYPTNPPKRPQPAFSRSAPLRRDLGMIEDH